MRNSAYFSSSGCDKLPVSNPTCVAIGSSNLDVIFVTSGRFGPTPNERTEQPHAGSLLALRTCVRGRPEFRYAGSKAIRGLDIAAEAIDMF
jgi:hypothetical protein